MSSVYKYADRGRNKDDSRFLGGGEGSTPCAVFTSRSCGSGPARFLFRHSCRNALRIARAGSVLYTSRGSRSCSKHGTAAMRLSGFVTPCITDDEYKNPLLVERGFLYSWWRRGESNPCPKTIERQDYMRSLRFIVANGAPEDRLGRPPSTFPASRVHLIPTPVNLVGTIRTCITSFAAPPESPALDAHRLLSCESVIEVFGD